MKRVEMFKNLDKPGTFTSKNADIATKVLVELKKFWDRSNIPIQDGLD